MSWKMKLVFLIAGEELDKWASRLNKIAFKMGESMAAKKIMSTQKIEPYTIQLSEEAAQEWELHRQAISDLHRQIDAELARIRKGQK